MPDLYAVVDPDDGFIINLVLWDGGPSWNSPPGTEVDGPIVDTEQLAAYPAPPADYVYGAATRSRLTSSGSAEALVRYALLDTAGGWLVSLVRWNGDTTQWTPPPGTTAVLASTVDFATLPPPP